MKRFIYRESEKGFTLLELVVVITILIVVFVAMYPQYRNYNERQQLATVVREVKTEIRAAQNKAINGVLPTAYRLESYWVVHMHPAAYANNHYETGSCPVTHPDNSRYSFIFNGCEKTGYYQQEYKKKEFDSKYHIKALNIPAGIESANMYFAPLTGEMNVYGTNVGTLNYADSNAGKYIANELDFVIYSDSITNICYYMHVNSKGSVSEDKKNVTCP